MKRCSKCGADKAVDDFYINSRNGKPSSHCKACQLVMGRAWYAKNREKRLVKLRAWNKAHPEYLRKASAKYRSLYPERVVAYRERTKEQKSEYHRKWYAKNLEKKRAANRQYMSARYWGNPELGRARNRAAYMKDRERAIQRQIDRQRQMFMPNWANRDAIASIYSEARRLTKETGIEHHVDHIIPLRGKTVCGLHVETNLQILTAEANKRKNARFECA